jgi:soluble lytic murein transglycosylase
MRVFLLILFLIVSAAPARSDIYSYIDGDGAVHFTNTPTSTRYRWFMPETSVEKDSYSSYDHIIREASSNYGVDAALIRAVIKVESDFNPLAVSEDGAVGLMQLMPKTAELMGVRDLYNPVENINGGVRFLKRLLTEFSSDITLAVAAYNAGKKAVERYNGIPPFKETRRYVKRVLDYYKIYKTTGI